MTNSQALNASNTGSHTTGANDFVSDPKRFYALRPKPRAESPLVRES